MLKINCTKISQLLTRHEWLLFALGLTYALFWQSITPIQYTGDSDSYLSAAQMLLGHAVGMPPIFRPPGYPLFLLFTGAVVPGTFIVVLFLQSLFAGLIPILIYRIIAPEGPCIALVAAIISIVSGVVTVHTPQIMTEPLFTFLLFLGITIAIKLVRNPNGLPNSIYWFAGVFAFLNMVRPIGAPMFWLMLAVICGVWCYRGAWPRLWKKAAGAALIFIAVMTVWTMADDILFSTGARYSPLNVAKVGVDNRVITYLYDLPFNESYFDIWARRVAHPEVDPATFASLADRPAMAKIRDVVRAHIAAHQGELKAKNMNRDLFGKLASRPEELVHRMFAEPNYVYANYVRAAIETDVTQDQRLKLYHQAAKEAGYSFPMRWFKHFSLKSILLGPSHGSGASVFLLAYTASPPIKATDGTATRLMFDALGSILKTQPELWSTFNKDEIFYDKYKNDTDGLIAMLLADPNQEYAWFMQVMLWDLMGYDTSSDLMGKVGYETYHRNPEKIFFRDWEMLLFTAAGPGADISGRKIFSEADIYGYLETPEMRSQEIKEVRATHARYQAPYPAWQNMTKTIYIWFYILKPVFLILSLIALGVLWVRGHFNATLMLIIPYGISVGIYGLLFTSLSRYLDPAINIPIMLICWGLASWSQRNEVLKIT